MISYGWEQHVVAPTRARRLAHRVLGTYDIGARVRSNAVTDAIRQLPPPAAILDAGCGRGQLSFQLHRRWPNAQILGIDIEDELIEHCHELSERLDAYPAVQFERRTLPSALGRTFDLVVSVDVLEHVHDDEGFVRCLFDATSSGGALVLHTPAVPQKRYLGEYEHQHDHVRDGYAPGDLRNLIRSAGYNNVDVRYTFGTYGALAWEIFTLARSGRAFAKAILPAAYPLAWIDGLQRPCQGNGLLAVAYKR